MKMSRRAQIVRPDRGTIYERRIQQQQQKLWFRAQFDSRDRWTILIGTEKK